MCEISISCVYIFCIFDVSHERHLFAQQESLSATDSGGLGVKESAKYCSFSGTHAARAKTS